MRQCWSKVLCHASLAGLLAGCAALPPAVMIAGQALDGISYLTTGKSGTDHVLSAALDEDCAVHRIVTGGTVCQTTASADVQTASLAVAPPLGPQGASDGIASDDGYFSVAARDTAAVPETVAPPGPERDGAAARQLERGLGADGVSVPDRVAPEPPAATAEARADEDKASAPTADPASRYFVVLGSFSIRANAERASARIAATASADPVTGPHLVAGSVSGRTVYRVVSGPFERGRGISADHRYADAGLRGTWRLPACAVAAGAPCIAKD